MMPSFIFYSVSWIVLFDKSYHLHLSFSHNFFPPFVLFLPYLDRSQYGLMVLFLEDSPGGL